MEIESLESKHVEELKNVRKTEQAQLEILDGIKSYQSILVNLQSKLDGIHDSSVNVQEQIKIIKEEHTESGKIIEFANNQIAESRDKLVLLFLDVNFYMNFVDYMLNLKNGNIKEKIVWFSWKKN